MTSPPALDNLQISNPPNRVTSPIKSKTPTSARPPSPSPSPPENRSDLPEVDGPSKPDGLTDGIDAQDTPPQTPAADGPSPSAPMTAAPPPARQPSPPASLPRPQPPTSMASAQNVIAARAPPGRPTPGMMARGGMPMPMGMRGPGGMGGGAQMQTRLPPSLQAKMDKVGALASSGGRRTSPGDAMYTRSGY